MNNKIFLSFAVPTYNRADSLKKLLNNVLPQAKELKDEIEICISSNGSTDNTREVVVSFKEKYPELIIKYGENEKNLGVDANIIKVMEMCQGDFIWTFSDDDYIVENGLKEIVSFLKRNNREDMGLAVLRVESFLVDKKTKEKKVFTSNFDANKPEVFKIDRSAIIGLGFQNIAFISILIFNNKYLKKIFVEDMNYLKRGIGISHIHMIIFSTMFLKYPHLNGFVFNKIIVKQDMPEYRYFVEDKFTLHYQLQRKMNSLLLSNKYMNKEYAPLIIQRGRGLRKDFIADMTVMRAFKNFNYFSYFGCLKLFFKNSSFIDALIFSSVFSALFLIPPAFLILLYKMFLMIKLGKKWKNKWEITSSVAYSISKGTRRRNEQPH